MPIPDRLREALAAFPEIRRRAPLLLHCEITRDDIVLMDREAGAWSRFKARAMLDWWDWAPRARQIHQIAAQGLRKELGHGPA